LSAIVTFAIEAWQPQPFKAALDAHGINSALSFREFAQFDFGDKGVDWCLRLSPHYYNTEEEVAQVVAAVAGLAGRTARFAGRDGHVRTAPDHRSVVDPASGSLEAQ
jgi:selenocysteine lyase/cysteine desulfurase